MLSKKLFIHFIILYLIGIATEQLGFKYKTLQKAGTIREKEYTFS